MTFKYWLRLHNRSGEHLPLQAPTVSRALPLFAPISLPGSSLRLLHAEKYEKSIMQSIGIEKTDGCVWIFRFLSGVIVIY